MITQQQFNEARERLYKNSNDMAARFTIVCYYLEQNNLNATREYIPSLLEKLSTEQLVVLFTLLKNVFPQQLGSNTYYYGSDITIKDLLHFLSLVIKLQEYNVSEVHDWLVPEKESYKTLLQWAERITRYGYSSSIKDFYIQLGNFHKKDKAGLPKNNSAAIECFVKAYNLSQDGDTANQIGCLYYTQKDRENALRYFKAGSQLNYFYASYNAGFCHHYPDEKGVEDLKEAETFYERTINQVGYGKVYPEAHFQLGRLYKKRYSLEKNQQLRSNYYGSESSLDKSKRHYKKAADNDHGIAGFELGCLYQEENNLKEAEVYFKKAESKEHKEALVKLFHLYRLQNRTAEAQNYLKLAATEGDTEANYVLGCQYEANKDYNKAFECFHQALLKNHEKAQEKLKNSSGIMSSYYLLYQKLKSEGDNFKTVLEKMQPYLALQHELNYFFNNPQYLFEALDRNTNNSKKEAPFQRLEFLGDSILTVTIRTYLIMHMPEKWRVGDADKSAQELIANKTVLPQVAKQLKLATLIQKDRHEVNHDITDKMLSDAMESLIGAVVQDEQEKSCSLFLFAAAGEIICRLWDPYLKQTLKMPPCSATQTLPIQGSHSNYNVSSSSATLTASPTKVIQTQQSTGIVFLSQQYNPTLFAKGALVSTYKQSLLTKGGANCHNGKKGNTPLMALINQEKLKHQNSTSAFNQDALDKMELLLSHGASWTEKNSKGTSAEDLFKALPEVIKKNIPERLHPQSSITHAVVPL